MSIDVNKKRDFRKEAIEHLLYALEEFKDLERNSKEMYECQCDDVRCGLKFLSLRIEVLEAISRIHDKLIWHGDIEEACVEEGEQK